MNTVTPEQSGADWSAYQDEPAEPLPHRPRRQFFNRRTAAFGALITCAIGFYAGVRIEKGQLAGSSTTSSAAAGGAARGLGAAGGGAGAAARGGFGSAQSGAGRAGGFAGAAGAAGGAAAGGAGGGASFGTVASVSGKTIYVTETSGNTVKVRLSSATKVSKTQPVPRSAIRPGDTIIVQGVTGSGGTVSAASVTDSGTRPAGGARLGFGGGGGTGKSGGGNSAVGSLFSSGG
ncbi:MAG TPA: hypothetical protein VGI07_05975 [Solirubrobacteraceae bacterium]